MTEKTVWEMYSLGIQQQAPRMTGDIVCYPPPSVATPSLAEWPERARLICAAPDLLAACELVIAWEDDVKPLSFTTDVYPALKAAVAKAKPEPLCGVDCPICEDEGHTPDEPAPALKTWRIRTDDGPLSMTAERAEEYDGGLAFYVGTNIVGRVAAGRWIAYWEDANG